jgi:hypothetical protein
VRVRDTASTATTALKQYYKSYSKILTKVINKAEKLNYNGKIATSNNTIKTTWNIIKTEFGKKSARRIKSAKLQK